MKVTIQQRQTLSDIAIQVYGDVRAVSALAEANSVGITDDLEAGTVLNCPDVIYDQYLQRYVRTLRLSPATSLEGGELDLRIFTEQFTKEFN